MYHLYILEALLGALINKKDFYMSLFLDNHEKSKSSHILDNCINLHILDV